MLHRKKLLGGLVFALVLVAVLAIPFAQGADLQGAFSKMLSNVTRGQFYEFTLTDEGYPLNVCTGTYWTDVPLNHPNCDALETAYDLGFFTQPQGGEARPDDLMTRAEGAKSAHHVYGFPLADPMTPTYTDVPRDTWFYEYVEGLHAAGATRIDSGEWHPVEILKRRALKWWSTKL